MSIQNYLEFKGNNEFTFKFKTRANLEYSLDRKQWSKYVSETEIVCKNRKLYLRGYGNRKITYCSHIDFLCTKGTEIECNGDIRTLLDYHDVNETKMSQYCFCGLFENCEALIKAPDLPSMELIKGCYMRMFSRTNLRKAPKLPALELKEYCYRGMFSFCTSLIEAPELPAKILSTGCYYCMFSECVQLENPPYLSFNNLATNCYSYMFESCNLNRLPFTEGIELRDFEFDYWDRCCRGMFFDGMKGNKKVRFELAVK